MYKIDLSPLLKEQFKLDVNIQNNHHITYRETFKERKLALLVELGEFANTTRCFKFWSNKWFDTKERVLDEAADCLHFYLSLYISYLDKSFNLEQIERNHLELYGEMDEPRNFDKKYLTSLFINATKYASNEDFINDIIANNFNAVYPRNSFECFLSIISGLGYSWQDLEEAYYKKLGVNYQRQENNY